MEQPRGSCKWENHSKVAVCRQTEKLQRRSSVWSPLKAAAWLRSARGVRELSPRLKCACSEMTNVLPCVSVLKRRRLFASLIIAGSQGRPRPPSPPHTH